MKALVQSKQYSLNITSTSTFNLNNIDWHKIDGRIDSEETYSRSTIKLLYPPNSDRDTQMLYVVSCKSDIPGIPIAEVENYFNSSSPMNIRISSSSDSWKNFPLNTYRMADYSFSPSDIYGTFMDWDGQKPYFMLGPQYWNENYAAYVISPQWRVPTITGININNSDPRQNITLSWSCNIQDLVDVQIWQDGILKTTLEGTTGESAVIPANTLHSGAFTVIIVAANNPIDDLGITGTGSATFTASMVAPTVNSLAANQLEPRLPITLGWASTNQTDFRADIIQNGITKASLIGGADKTAIVPANTLTEGAFTVNLYVNNTVNGVASTSSISQSFSAALDRPVVTSLEPYKINNNINLPILCTWASSRQETYILKLIQDNTVKKVYSGTTEQQLNIPADTFESGTCYLELTTSNVINGTTISTTRVSEFLGYGRPKLPIFSEQTIYNQALPLFTWVSDEQIALKFEVWKDSILIEQSNEVISTVSEFEATIALENHSEYKIKVQTKNQYGLWSYISEKVITTNYSTLTKPEFALIPDAAGGILINLAIVEETGFASAEIWRKDEYSKFVRLATNMAASGQWTDYTLAGGKEYFYKVISLTNDGGLTESDTKIAKIKITGFSFLDINKTEPLKLKRNPKTSSSLIRDIVSFEFAGRTAPKLKKGLMNYRIFKMSFELDSKELDKFTELVDKAETILYRDGRGNKAYGQILGDFAADPVPSNIDRSIIGFTFTETSFIEKDLYDGQGG